MKIHQLNEIVVTHVFGVDDFPSQLPVNSRNGPGENSGMAISSQ